MSRMKTAILIGLVVLAIPVGVVTAKPAAAFSSCDPGFVYTVNSHSYTFINSNLGTKTIYNGTPYMTTEQISFSSSVSVTVDWQLSNGASIGAAVYILSAEASTGTTLSTSTTKAGGWTLTANIPTPSHHYAHAQFGAFGQHTSGTVSYVNQNCSQTYEWSVSYANAPHPGDFGLNSWED